MSFVAFRNCLAWFIGTKISYIHMYIYNTYTSVLAVIQ